MENIINNFSIASDYFGLKENDNILNKDNEILQKFTTQLQKLKDDFYKNKINVIVNLVLDGDNFYLITSIPWYNSNNKVYDFQFKCLLCKVYQRKALKIENCLSLSTQLVGKYT